MQAGELTTLLDAHPKAVREKSKDGGNLPLHVVLAAGGGVGAVQALLMRWPGAAKVRPNFFQRGPPPNPITPHLPLTTALKTVRSETASQTGSSRCTWPVRGLG